MRIKLVTGYWMDIVEKGYTSAPASRKDRYLGSIISHCKGFNYPVVCYTHSKNFEEVEKIKIDYNLTNLEIKIKELTDIKYSKSIKKIQSLKSEEELYHLNGRPPEVMWGKFDVLSQEATDDIDYVYWVDAGLQSNQIFPYRHCPNINHSDFFSDPYKQYNFTLVFNRSMLDKLTNNLQNKFVNLVGTNPQDQYFNFDDYSPKPGNYPIAGFFGGHRNTVSEYCDLFSLAVDKFIDKEILCFEQSIMKYVIDNIDPSKLLLYSFDTHQTGIDENTFHYKEWDSNMGLPKPIFRIWEEILLS